MKRRVISRANRRRVSGNGSGNAAAVIPAPQPVPNPPAPALAGPVPSAIEEESFEVPGDQPPFSTEPVRSTFELAEHNEDEDLAILKELAGPGLALIYRVQAGVRGMVGKVERNRVLRDHELIGISWGGGDYEVDFRDEKGHPVKRFVRFRFDPLVYGPPKGPAGPAPSAQQAVDPTVVFLREQQQQTNQLLTTVLSALVNRPAPEAGRPMGMDEVLRAAQVMVESKQADAAGKIESLEKFVETAVANAVEKAGEASGSPFERILTTVVSAAVPLISQLAAKQSDKGGVTAAAPARGGPAGKPGRSKEETDLNLYVTMARAHPLVKQHSPTIMAWATAQRDPVEAAADAYNLVPAENREQALGFLSRPDCWWWIHSVEPKAVPYKDWFAELVKELRQLLSAPAEPASDGTEVAIPEDDDEEIEVAGE